MADARITELTPAAWSSSLTFAVVDAGTTKRIGSDQFLLTTTAQASAVAQVVAAAAVSGKLTGTTAQVVSAAAGISTTIIRSHGASGASVSAAVSKDEVVIVLDGASQNAINQDLFIDLSTDGGSSYVATGYYSFGSSAAGVASELNTTDWFATFGNGVAAADTVYATITIKGLRATGVNARKTISGVAQIVGDVNCSFGGYVNISAAVNGVRFGWDNTGVFDAGTVIVMERG